MSKGEEIHGERRRDWERRKDGKLGKVRKGEEMHKGPGVMEKGDEIWRWTEI